MRVRTAEATFRSSSRSRILENRLGHFESFRKYVNYGAPIGVYRPGVVDGTGGAARDETAWRGRNRERPGAGG